MASHAKNGPDADARDGTWGVLCALPEELGTLPGLARGRRDANGLELLELELSGQRVLAACAGVGKVRAARGAALLVAAGVDRGLLVVGVCGGLRAPLEVGELVHCTRAVQADLAVRQDREVEPDPRLLAAWRAAQPGHGAWFLTADRPALSWWRRRRLAKAYAGPCVAEMETAAAGRVAEASGVPWAALRAVSDGPGPGGLLAFRTHFPVQAGRAADTVPRLLAELGGSPGSTGER